MPSKTSVVQDFWDKGEVAKKKRKDVLQERQNCIV